ncbi:MAG: hypothetical protein IJS30_06355 [Bacteroidales bacterium]|nr:hypothetical protein [Bacteroidales bacterium]
MKRILLTALCMVMALGQVFSQEIKDRAEYNLNRNRALWYNSGNAAGLARDEMLLWRDVAFSYGIESGKFTDSWGARTISGFSLGGSTLMDIEGFTVAAKLTLDRERLYKCKYNTSLYELTWDMPFFVATNNSESFLWKHNEADIEVSAAAPLIFDGQLSVGMALRTNGRTAVKSADPQSRYGSFDMEMAPGATFVIDDDNLVGMTLRYRFNPAKTTLASDVESPARVAFMRGLGDYTPRWVSAIGMDRLSYISNRFGVDLQYNRIGAGRQWLMELSFDAGTTRVEETDFTLGKVNKFVFGLGVQGLFGEGRNRKLNVDVKYNRFHWTEGTEDIIGRGGIIDLHADYTLYTDAKDISYDLELGAGADVTSISARRIAGLEGHFSSFSVLPYVLAGKNIPVTKESTLLARVSLGINYSAKPGYELEGDSIYKKMYKDEADYLGRFFYRNAADVEYTFRMNTMLSTYARLSLVHQMPMTIKGGRILATLAVGVLF